MARWGRFAGVTAGLWLFALSGIVGQGTTPAGPWRSTFAVAFGELVPTGRNPYVVLVPTYTLTLEHGDERLVITVLPETLRVDGVDTHIVEERETRNGELVEVSRNYFAISSRTNAVYYFGEDVDIYTKGKVTSHEGAWRAGVGGARFGMMMPGEPRLDSRYYQEVAPKIALDRAAIVGLAETVTTPAGVFRNCLKIEETTPLEPDAKEYKYYAPGVGIVRDGDLKLVSRSGLRSIDIAGDAARQVVVDRESGQYLGHPTTVLLEDGQTMIAVYPRGHGSGGIVMKKSPDGGRTWSARLPTPASWATSKETPTIHRVVDRSGKKRLILFSGLYPIRMSVSEDDGATWSELEPVGPFGGIVAMASVERLKNGDYMALFHDDERFIREGGAAARPPVFHVYKTISTDGGLTWGAPVVIATHPQAMLCEPGLVRSPDGRQIAVLLRENSRKFRSFVIFSDDEGRTWSAPRELPASLTGDRHTAKYAADGRLLVSFRDMGQDGATKGDWIAWVGRYEDLAFGRDGQYRMRLMDNKDSWDCCYPGVEVLRDGVFVLTTYGYWIAGEPPFVVSVRLRLDEIDALAERSAPAGR